MTLRGKRVSFTNSLAKLILWAGENGIEVAIGPDGLKHMEHSLHFVGLAVDLNAYREGQYMTSTEEYRSMGEYWKTLSPWARWGGGFGDGNHFSYEHEGRK